MNITGAGENEINPQMIYAKRVLVLLGFIPVALSILPWAMWRYIATGDIPYLTPLDRLINWGRR